MVRDAAAEARIGREELVHPVFIASQDHNQIVSLVLHDLQQDFDGFLAVIALVLGAVQVIGLVDEQNAAHRLFEHFLRLRRRVADILADKVVARHRNEMPAPDIAKPVQNISHPHRNRRLAGPRIAGEAHMKGWRVVCEPEAFSRPLDEQQSGDFPDAGFDRLQPDKLAVELVENLGYP